MSEAKENPIVTVGYVPALAGTKAVTFLFLFDEHAEPPYERHETPIVAWRIRSNIQHDYTSAEPIGPGGRAIFEEEDCAIVMPDGTIHFETDWPDAGFDGKTVEDFEEFVGAAMRRYIDEYRCLDCRESLAGHLLTPRSPMLQDELWRSIVPDGKGVLCRDDMEKRLGRKLVLADLKSVPGQDLTKYVHINKDDSLLKEMAERIRARMGKADA
jgi:hypothetical protein